MRWLWIDRIVAIEPAARLIAIKHVSLAEEHLHDHFPASGDDGARLPADPVMPATLIIEGAAQSAGVLIGLARDLREKVVLAKISRATLDADARPGDTIRFDARLDRLDDAGASATVHVAIAPPDAPAYPIPAGVVELLFSHLDRNLSGATFPEHNFVFGDSFRTLLETSNVPIPDLD